MRKKPADAGFFLMSFPASRGVVWSWSLTTMLYDNKEAML